LPICIYRYLWNLGLYTTAVIRTAYSLALLKMRAVASTSLGKGSAFGAAVKYTSRGLHEPMELVDA
jgi:hypothetical protein